MSRASVLAVVALGAAAASLPALGQDRYGAAAYPPMIAPGSGMARGPSAALRGRTLSWPGKQDRMAAAPSLPASAYAPQAYPDRGYAPRSYGPPTNSTALSSPAPYAPSRFGARPYAASQEGAQSYPAAPTAGPVAYPPPTYTAPAPEASNPDGWRPVFAQAPPRGPVQNAPAGPPIALAGAPSRPAEAPDSIYTPAATPQMTPAQRAAAAPPPLRTASVAQRYGYDPSQGHQVRFYSVHRPFGLQPDAAPIPPQFFTATADLSQPAGPLPTDRTTTTTTASGARVSHVAPDTSVN